MEYLQSLWLYNPALLIKLCVVVLCSVIAYGWIWELVRGIKNTVPKKIKLSRNKGKGKKVVRHSGKLPSVAI